MIRLHDDTQVDPKPVGNLPLLMSVIDQLQIPDVLDELLPKDPRNRVADSDCVSVMLLNILSSGRAALYAIERWANSTDLELVLGEGCTSDAFNDARLAACLDHIAAAGTEEVLSRVVLRYLQRDDTPTTYTVHHDTTSISVYGAYEGFDEGPLPAQGFSKDHRPDLKQLVFGMTLHGAVGIPLTSAMYEGSTSDVHANRINLDQLGDLLPDHHDVTLVADAKLVDARTLGQLLDQKFHFVSLLPRNFKLRDELVEEVRTQSVAMPELARQVGRTKGDPERVYRGRSFPRSFSVGIDEQNRRDVPLRFVVISSDQADDSEDSVDRKVKREHNTLSQALSKVEKETFLCAADARRAIEGLSQKQTFHQLKFDILSTTETLKRSTRGRPKHGDAPETREVWRAQKVEIVPNAEAIARAEFHARHFVLVTDHLDETVWPDDRILGEYRHQHVIEGHTGFRWLKNLAAVAPVLLHTPQRIAALGVVLVLALMVRNYIQFTVRRRLVETKESVPDRLGKPTQKPTTETAMIPFHGLIVTRIVAPGAAAARHAPPMSKAASTVMRMLSVEASVFVTPRRRFGKITGQASGTSGM